MDFSQIKKTLYVFLAIRLILDVLAFIFGFTAGVDEDDDDSIKKCLESLGPLTALGEASYAVDRVIVLCIMIMFSTNWRPTPQQMLIIAIALFYEASIGLAVWGIFYPDQGNYGEMQ